MPIRWGLSFVLALVVSLSGCAREDAQPQADGPAATPVYNETTGRLEQIVSDRDGDGVKETRAFMDGARLLRIEIDRNADGQVDRWEFYDDADGAPPAEQAAPAGQAGEPTISRAEEANGSSSRVTRREFYENGVLARVEEDADDNGAVDKWETYTQGQLRHVDLDLTGAGRPNRRLVYDAAGNVTIQVDPDGDGTFTPLSSETPDTR